MKSVSQGTFDARLSYVIRYPSAHLGESGTDVATIVPIEAFDSDEDIRHVTVNSLNAPHLGLFTVWGDFTGVFVAYETSDTMALLEELRLKQLYFDIVITALDEGGGTDYKVEQAACVGCKLGRRSKRHRYGAMPSRTYRFTYCSGDETLQSGDDYHDIKGMGLGRVTATIGEGEAAGTPNKETELTTA